MTLKLVIVDGNPADRGIIRRMLDSSDLEVALTELTGVRDFLRLEVAEYDCVLIDARFPDGDGIEALAECCNGKSYPPCPIIIMSTHGDEHTAARAFKAGANDYLIKDSMTPNSLMRTVVNSIEKWHAEDAIRNNWEMQRHALRDAERANTAKSRFIASLSHQLRTPLTTIIGFSELIEAADHETAKDDWERYRNYAGDISRSAREVLELMNGIINLARIENGEVPLTTSSFDPRKALRDVIEAFSEYAINAHVDLRVDDQKAPHLMVSDDHAMMVIMTNLLSNAIKYTPAGSHVDVHLQELDGDKCLFSVADSGSGLSKDDLLQATRPFEIYKPQIIASDNELGIGMSFVNSLVQTLGGDLKFNSTPGIGTTATVILPKTVQGEAQY